MNPLWLLQNWRVAFPSPCFEVGITLISVICGAIVGSERQKHEKPAGMRTLTLVSLGSTAFTLASYAFTTSTNDSGRVAAQIVTGIGFLGAGVIMRGRGIINGATTAATIWVTAAIGMVVGSGYAIAGLALSILVRLVLAGIRYLEMRTLAKIKPVPVVLEFDPDHGKARVRLERILSDFNVDDSCLNWMPHAGSDGLSTLTLKLHLQRHHLMEMLGEMVEDAAVKAVHGVPDAAKQEEPPKKVF